MSVGNVGVHLRGGSQVLGEPAGVLGVGGDAEVCAVEVEGGAFALGRKKGFVGVFVVGGEGQVEALNEIPCDECCEVAIDGRDLEDLAEISSEAASHGETSCVDVPECSFDIYQNGLCFFFITTTTFPPATSIPLPKILIPI